MRRGILKIRIAALAGLVLLVAPVLADEPPDCVAEVRTIRDAAAANGEPLSRREQVVLLHECNSRYTQARIAEQERTIAALDDRLAALQLRIDRNNQILDENNQVIAYIEAIDGQLVVQRRLEAQISDAEARSAASRARIADAEARSAASRARIADAEARSAASRARQEAMLAEAERILQSLVAQ